VAGLNAGGQRFAGDDGQPDPRVAAIVAAYAAGRAAEGAVLAALAATRLLIPLVERDAGDGAPALPAGACGAPGDGICGAPGRDACGTSRDGACAAPGEDACGPAKEMSVPTLIGRDGRPALPAFTGLDALARWRPDARPVPAPAAQVWATAVAGSCAVVIDVAGPVPVAVAGARLGALAEGQPPPAPQDDPDVRDLVAEVLAAEPGIVGARLAGGTGGTDLAVRLTFRAGNAAPPVQGVAEAIAARLAGRLRRGIEVSAAPAAARR